jgi:hypothetical protein
MAMLYDITNIIKCNPFELSHFADEQVHEKRRRACLLKSQRFQPTSN